MTTAASVTWPDVAPHLRTTLYMTGCFVVAWSWDLVCYGLSHVRAGTNPLQQQIGFVVHDVSSPTAAPWLLLHYLVVCTACAVASQRLQRHDKAWTAAAVTAVEFLPAPVLAGQLMAYLTQFEWRSVIVRALLNLAAVAGAAALAHAVPDDGRWVRYMPRFTPIVRQTLGFGLGIAWNTLLAEVFAPRAMMHNEGAHTWGLASFVGYIGYLGAMGLLALRLAAMAATPASPPTFLDRQRALLSFAAQVVCAFTLVTLLQAMPYIWNVSVESLVLLVLLSAVATAAVAGMEDDLGETWTAARNSNDNDDANTATSPAAKCLVLIPCVWCCCPWLPLLLVLAGSTPPMALIRDAWFALVAMVTGLAASITAANGLTSLTDAWASGFCTAAQCPTPVLFLLLQMVVALLTTVLVLAAVAPLTPVPPAHDVATTTTTSVPPPPRRRDEEERLLV